MSAQQQDKSCIRMVQGNLRHCREAMATLNQHLLTGKSDFALIQEPYVTKDRVTGLSKSLGTVFKGTRIGRPRTCIFVHKRYNAILLQELSNEDLTVLYLERKVKGASEPLVVASAYLPYDHPEGREHCTEELIKLIEYCKSEELPLLVGCDANAHHVVWGSTNVNSRGESLLEYLSSTDLEILNRGNSPTFVIENRQEVIDITLATPDLMSQVSRWH